MKITAFDKLSLITDVYSVIPRFASITKAITLFLRPLDAPRYTEFAYLQKFLHGHHRHNLSILDVSSPYIMSYILSSGNKVIKTDIDSSEKKFIKESHNLKFKIEDATGLTFEKDTFDLVYSVSVVEHIYEKYLHAIYEMLRVVKKGGHIYITFPVSKKFQEEWVQGEVYEKQHTKDGKTFFQYRFDKTHVATIMEGIAKHGGEVLHSDIFWERNDGDYDVMIGAIKNKKSNRYFTFLKDICMNAWYGFFLFNESPVGDFSHATSCGNMHVIIKKK